MCSSSSEELHELVIVSQVINRMDKELNYLKSWVNSRISRSQDKIGSQNQEDYEASMNPRIDSYQSFKNISKVELKSKDTIDIDDQDQGGGDNVHVDMSRHPPNEARILRKKITPSSSHAQASSTSTSSRSLLRQVEMKQESESPIPSPKTFHFQNELQRFGLNSTNNNESDEEDDALIIISEDDQRSPDNDNRNNNTNEADNNDEFILGDNLSFDVDDRLEVQIHEALEESAYYNLPRKRPRIGEIENTIKNIPPGFLNKLWAIVNAESTDDLISWSEDGTSFIIKDATKIAIELFPILFKHNNLSSFIRQLNMYGFKKIMNLPSGIPLPFQKIYLVFAHEFFIKGHGEYLKKIKRRNYYPNQLINLQSV